MKRALIDPEGCANCDPCAAIEKCPNSAIFRESESDKPWVDFYRCSGCMKCKANCALGAIIEITQPCNGKPRMGW